MKKTQLDALRQMNDTQLRIILCGKPIGCGISRRVYECKLDSNYVVKWSFVTPPCENIIEYVIWDAYKYAPDYCKWFAEIIFISRSGRFIIQRKIIFKSKKKDYPKHIPIFFSDISIENFGFLDGQLQCCDYASVLPRLTGLVGIKMRYAKW